MLMPIRAHLIDVTAPTKDGTPAKKAKKMERSGLHDERHGLRHFDGAKEAVRRVLTEAVLPDGLGYLAAVSRGEPCSRIHLSRCRC